MDHFCEFLDICGRVVKHGKKEKLSLESSKKGNELTIDVYENLFEISMNFKDYWEDISKIYIRYKTKILKTSKNKDWIKGQIVLHLGGCKEDLKSKNWKLYIGEIYKKSLRISRKIKEENEDYFDIEEYDYPETLLILLLKIFVKGLKLELKQDLDGEEFEEIKNNIKKLKNIIYNLENKEEEDDDNSGTENIFGSLGGILESLQSGDPSKGLKGMTGLLPSMMDMLPGGKEAGKAVVGGLIDSVDSMKDGNFSIESISETITGVLAPVIENMNMDAPDGVTVNNEDNDSTLNEIKKGLNSMLDNM